MLKAFCLWLAGVEEDDPIPYEVKHLYFYVHKKEIGFGASELKHKRVDNFQYYPLEAQYFDYSYQLLKDGKELEKLKLLLKDAFETREIKNIYYGKTVHLGELYQEIVYSFKV